MADTEEEYNIIARSILREKGMSDDEIERVLNQPALPKQPLTKEEELLRKR